MGTGDHEHGNGPLNRAIWLTHDGPDDVCDEAGGRGDVKEKRGRAVGECLSARSRLLRLLHEAPNTSKGRALTYRVYSNADRRIHDHGRVAPGREGGG